MHLANVINKTTIFFKQYLSFVLICITLALPRFGIINGYK